jgi:hypothetical protein
MLQACAQAIDFKVDHHFGEGQGLAEWEQTHGKKKAKCVLTSTGLLTEGVEAKMGSTPTPDGWTRMAERIRRNQDRLDPTGRMGR